MMIALAMMAGVACGEKKSESSAAGKESGPPKIEAVEAEFDFGTVKQGVDVEHTFKIRNVGAKELVIEKTSGS